jgi:hypothetical protein
MKKVCGYSLLAVVFLFGMGVGVHADILATATPHDSYGSTNGGEFLFTYADFDFTPVSLAGTPPGQFETFCVEKNQHIHLDTTYYATFSTSHAGLNGEPLNALTAYLYQQFVTGQLAGYVYDVTAGDAARIASADALQHVVWYSENQESKAWTDGDGSLMDQFYQNAVLNAGTDLGQVRIMNLWADSAGTIAAQGQLVLVPEPTSLLMLACLPIVLTAWRRHG